MNEPYKFYLKSADYVRARMPFQPELAVILGSSLGPFAAGILIVHIVEFFEERGTDVRGWLNARKSSVQLLILLVSLLILAFFGIFRSGYISSEFIYGQF